MMVDLDPLQFDTYVDRRWHFRWDSIKRQSTLVFVRNESIPAPSNAIFDRSRGVNFVTAKESEHEESKNVRGQRRYSNQEMHPAP